jgi:hypothetical protein
LCAAILDRRDTVPAPPFSTAVNTWRSPAMSDAQIVLAFIFGDQPSTLDDKKTALSLAKECRDEVARIAGAMGKSRGTDGKWA